MTGSDNSRVLVTGATGRIGRYEELPPDEFRRETAATWPPGFADMLLAAWGAAVGHPAFVTSTVGEILGVPPRRFAEWATDHAAWFMSAHAAP